MDHTQVNFKSLELEGLLAVIHTSSFGMEEEWKTEVEQLGLDTNYPFGIDILKDQIKNQ